MFKQESILQALNLPLADRLLIVNELVESFNPMNAAVQEKWKKELLKRDELLEKGQLNTLSYKEFFGEN